MTKKELFTCDICHTDFNSKEKALECEKSHRSKGSISDIRIRAKEKYPDKVLIEFDDGVEIWFNRGSIK